MRRALVIVPVVTVASVPPSLTREGEAAGAAQPTVWVLGAMSRVRPTTEPPAGASLDVALAATRGETEPPQRGSRTTATSTRRVSWGSRPRPDRSCVRLPRTGARGRGTPM